MQRVLSVGYVVGPFKQRNAVLAAAGLDVREAMSVKDGIALLDAEDFDVLVLGFALPTEDRNKLARAARKRSPRTRIIMLYDGRIVSAELADAIIGADDPHQVVETIRLISEDAKGRFECA